MSTAGGNAEALTSTAVKMASENTSLSEGNTAREPEVAHQQSNEQHQEQALRTDNVRLDDDAEGVKLEEKFARSSKQEVNAPLRISQEAALVAEGRAAVVEENEKEQEEEQELKLEPQQEQREPDEEEDEEEEEEEEGETRCICGEVDPPDESGLYIQCESCSVWQHGFCVGITDGEGSAPDKYWCESCRPELHTLYTTESDQRRSSYKPVQHGKRQNRRSRVRDDEVSNEGEKVRTANVTGGNSGRNRAAIEVSSVGVKPDPLKPATMQKETKSRKRQQRQKDANGEQAILGRRDSDEDRRSLDRRRATSSAREEKQYQLMLEKALKESRRTSQADEELGTHVFEEEKMSEGNEDDAVAVGPDTEATTDEPPKKRSKPSSLPATPATSSEEELKRKSKRGAPRKMKNRNAPRAPTSNGNDTTDIGINRPIKPRIPSQGTSMNEMRRRVSAILEYISRTQYELSEDQLEKQKLTEFVENEEFFKKVDTIYSSFDESLKMMDDLTGKLISWEKRYTVDQ
ncbi:LADA_0E03994g1_1 [Lachancea dasiensis]|uniref:LADA_0E03994g1_1 n=1 Tax=Lachancea dasiensis TaxID=1072105 RepID=A0A1G4JBI9_9SACH|nr:LADA_0E03994g1_1 [Lachancea dasiensis]